MKVAAMEMGKRTKGNPTWELVKFPKQTGNKECGVYRMKFMKHLMEDPLMSTKYKLKELGEAGTYEDEELNDICLELVEYILDFINQGE
ncbi:hypothetical protein IFM89_018910 [Coptis chinensis]|uniref:Ubiquitin-like protease family profile domain-containing protein n=1 Tax=Coptis chinensis TaxID=261450 RepID=A0A835HDS8_9MAGN|nr:hypothetical protein IFM89_018910 [Coptis chinensis]